MNVSGPRLSGMVVRGGVSKAAISECRVRNVRI
jgi:hypothetical protein